MDVGCRYRAPRGLRAEYRRSVADGALYAGMVGLGEFWFLTDAVRLGASSAQIAALVTVPQLVGAFGAAAMLRALRCTSARRPWVVGAVLLQVGVLIGLALASATGASTAGRLVVGACLYAAAGQAAGIAWSSWMGDLVPAPLRGRWFGTRTRWVSATTFLAIVAGGGLLQWLEPAAAGARLGGGLGYALVYGLAAAVRVGSAALLARSWEPPFRPPADHEGPLEVLRGAEGAGARAVVGTGAAMLVAVCLSTPFFASHMLDTLRFDYLTYLGAQAVMVATKVATLGAWGRLVDRVGAAPVYRLTALLVAGIPVLWMVADRASIVFVAQACSGVAWAGNEVALLALTLSASGPRRRAVLLVAQSTANGVAQVVGGALGTAIAGAPPDHALAFGASGAARALVFAWSTLAFAAVPAAPIAWWDLGARVVSWLPHGGLVRQLVLPGTRRRDRL
ncbi:MAG: hypothetical protein ABMA64_21570 [Myxococcota bacterium]